MPPVSAWDWEAHFLWLVGSATDMSQETSVLWGSAGLLVSTGLSSGRLTPWCHQAFGHVSLQVGACIVNAENKIVGIGYNGMPNGCSDDLLPWRRTAANKLDTKYPYGRACSCSILLSGTAWGSA